MGYETAMRFTKGNHAFIVATHTDKAHIHNHIIFNSTSLDCTHKFRDFFFVGLALQRLSDIICLEHGLSVIEKKKPSERVKRTTYPEKKSFRDDIKDAIDRILKEGSAKEFDELLYKLEDSGYEIKRGKHISLKGKDQKRFIRLRSLGDGYTEDDLKKILAGEMEHAFYDNEKAEKQPKTYQRKKEDHEFDLLIDIQKKLAQGKGKYYVRFAKNFNTKQVAKAVLYLKQHDIRSYDDLEKNVKTATVRFTELSASIEANEKRLAEIQVLKKHIFDDKGCTGWKNRHDTDKVGKPIRQKYGRFPADHSKTEGKECSGGFRERGCQHLGWNRRNPDYHLKQFGTGREP